VAGAVNLPFPCLMVQHKITTIWLVDSLICVKQKEDDIRKWAILFLMEYGESVGTTNSLL